LTRLGNIIYSIRQLHGRRRVCKVPGLKRRDRIRQSKGGIYPRLIFESSPNIARLKDFLTYVSEEAHQSLEIATPDKSGLAMTYGAVTARHNSAEAISRRLASFAGNDSTYRGLIAL